MRLLNVKDPALNALQDDLAALKRDLNTLVTHVRSGAADGVQVARGQIDAKARRLYRDAAQEGAAGARMVGDRVARQPLIALLLAGGLGFLSARLLSR